MHNGMSNRRANGHVITGAWVGRTVCNNTTALVVTALGAAQFKWKQRKNRVARFVGDETNDLGINEGNLCAKGRFGHGIIHNENRIQSPLINVGGTFKEVSWDEAIKTIVERVQATINRSGPETVAGIGGEKLTNEENYLFQKLFRGIYGSNQITNLGPYESTLCQSVHGPML